MADFIASVSGPLDKSACVYFFALTMFFFIVLVITFVVQMLLIFRDFKHLNSMNMITGIIMLFNIFLAYFNNRLLYTMCNKSLA